jgi:WD40 repeat protein
MQASAGVWVWRAEQPAQVHRLYSQQGAKSLDVSPDGRWCAFVGQDNHIFVYDLTAGVVVHQAEQTAGSTQFSPEGRWLYTSEGPGRLLEVGTWKAGPILGRGVSLCFSPDGRSAALQPEPGVFRLVEVASGRELATLEDPERKVGPAAFSCDGARLIVNLTEGVKVWNLRRIRAGLAELHLDWDAPPYPPATPRLAADPITVEFVGSLDGNR